MHNFLLNVKIVRELVEPTSEFYRPLLKGLRLSSWTDDFNNNTSVEVIRSGLTENKYQLKMLRPEIVFSSQLPKSGDIFFIGFGKTPVYEVMVV